MTAADRITHAITTLAQAGEEATVFVLVQLTGIPSRQLRPELDRLTSRGALTVQGVGPAQQADRCTYCGHHPNSAACQNSHP